MMWKAIINSFAMLVVMTVLTGIVYPLAMTGLAQAVFPVQANGSILMNKGMAVGSKLIGQNFTDPGYFHGRPSAAGAEGYDATASSGSNLGPTSRKLKNTVEERAALIRKENGLAVNAPVPSDLVLASGSGLDPHITPAAAYLQVKRVAKARGLTVAQVRREVGKYLEGRHLEFLGGARVNVLELNLALDNLKQ
jgi:K+-transporting ATPase ATPase C chain